MKKNVRWSVAGLLCLATGLNYLDRQTLSVLATTIQKDLGMTTADYGKVTFSFLIAYTVMYAVSGRIVDVMGSRRGLLFFASAWSVANMLHALARTTLQLSGFRILLGAAEAANFPACVKAVSEWFPVRERALAVGIVNGGVAIGSVVSVPLVSIIAAKWGWQAAFVATGALGFVWVAAWSRLYRLPADHPHLGEEERRLIEEGRTATDPDSGPAPSVWRLLKMRETWGYALARMMTDPISYFLGFWMPKFLQDARSFDLGGIGKFGWIPFAAFAAGSVASGAIPRVLVNRGLSVDRARKATMVVMSLSVPLSCYLLNHLSGKAVALGLVSALMFAHAAWGNMALAAEVFPKSVIGTIVGLGGMLGGAVGAVTQLVIGSVVEKHSYTPIFLSMSIIYPLASLVVVLLLRDLGRIRRV